MESMTRRLTARERDGEHYVERTEGMSTRTRTSIARPAGESKTVLAVLRQAISTLRSDPMTRGVMPPLCRPRVYGSRPAAAPPSFVPPWVCILTSD